MRTIRTFCHISCRPTHFHLGGEKRNNTVCRSKDTPTALLQVCTVISMNGRAKGDASKMGNEVELCLNVLSMSLMLQALWKPRASEKLISQRNQA